MRHNKRVGDEIFDPKTIEVHPQSWFAVFGRRIEDFSDTELVKIAFNGNNRDITK